jgi:hypothetical protein
LTRRLSKPHRTNNPAGKAESLFGQGRIALAHGEHAEARRFLEQTLVLADGVGPWTQLATLVELGYADSRLDETGHSRERFREALVLADETGFSPWTLSALIGMAHLLAREATGERAVELLALVLKHTATSRLTRDRAHGLLAELERRMQPETFAQAVARGRARELEEVVAQICTTGTPG